MKAIVVEIKGKYAAILTDEGLVSKVRNKNYALGQEIRINNKANRLIRMTATAAAAIMLFVTPAWAYLSPYSYVSLDVNPSFEFSINRFDRVLTVKAHDDDGLEYVKNINVENLKNKEIQDAVKNVLDQLKSQGYIIEGQEGGVIVATSSKTRNKTENLAEKLRNAVNEEEPDLVNEEDKGPGENTQINENRDEAEKPEKPQKPEKDEESGKPKNDDKPEKPEKPEKSEKPGKHEDDKKPEKPEKGKNKYVEVIEVTKEEVDQAKKLKVTPGKINLVRKLQEAAEPDQIDEDEWLGKSVKDINAKIKEYREDSRLEDKEKQNDKGPSEKDREDNKGKSKNND